MHLLDPTPSRRRPSTPRPAWLLAGLLALLLAPVLAPAPAPAAAQSNLIAYRMVDQWPQRDEAAEGLFQSPEDLDFMRDGRVFIADPGIGGVHVLLPTGSFTTPFGVAGGFPAQLGRVGAIAVGPDPMAPPFSAERVYVLDTAVERVVMYDAGGRFQDAWDGINGESIAASNDGRVYVLDRDASQVRVFDARSGQERFRIGERGTEDGQFSNFDDVDVSPDGRVLAVGDRRGLRVQLFDLPGDADLAGENPPAPWALRQVYDLRNAKYSSQDFTCSSSRVNAMGGDKVFVGEANGACLLDGRDVTFAIAASANSRTICKDTVSLPRLKGSDYYALAVSDPNAGKCGEKRQELDTAPVIVKYADELLKSVDTIWEAASNANSDNPLLFAPNTIAMPSDDVVFVQDSSSQLRFFDLQGKQLATAERSSQAGNFSSDFRFTNVIEATGSETLGEIYGYYIQGQRAGGAFQVEGGIGRFKTVEKRTQTGIERALEKVWTDPLISSFQEIDIPAIVYSPVSGELLVVRSERIEQQRSQEVMLVRYAPDGREIKPAFDLPDDGEVNPYVDLAVDPEGRIYALDDLADRVRVFERDGTPIVDVPVAFDARAVAAGPRSPEGNIFILREPGSIERYADDGSITARLDGRPLDFSDPTTLTDIAVDARGQVYVSDGQSSLISVFEPSDEVDAIPIPNDAECLFLGQAAVDPQTIQLGQDAGVTLSLSGRCGINEEPADIALVIPYYGRLEQGVDPSVALRNEATQLMARVNFGKHRVGIVSHYNTVTTELPLTDDRDAYLQALRDINRFTPPNPDIKPRLRDAMEAAAKLFDDPTRRRVMVLLRVDYCNPDNEFFPGQCQGYPPAEDAALAIRQSGVTVIAINSFGALDLASSDEDAFFGIEGAHRRMVRYRQPELLASGLRLVDEIPAELGLDPASVSGGGVWSAPELVWDVDRVDFGGLSLSLRLRPTQAGRLATSLRSEATLTDGWGNPQRVSFPIPELEVIAPTPTPVRETPTPLPSATPAPTETPEPTEPPQAVYLPWLSRGVCFPIKRRFDIALVVDVSSSMAEPAGPEGAATKLDLARESLLAFLDSVNLGADRVTLVDFASQARLVQGLSDDRGALDAAVRSLSPRSGTRIDAGLDLALDALTAEGARENAGKVIVLLSDGQQVEAPETARAAGEAARGRGVDLFAIGLGADADAALLSAVASDASHYYYAGQAAELTEIYARIAASIPGCP